MTVDVLLGSQWGDEGKGKIIHTIADDYDVVARFQGGPNAGHTIYVNDKKIILHHLPSGIVASTRYNLIGAGMVVDPITLKREIISLTELVDSVKERLLISLRAALIMPTHILLDKASERSKGKSSIGSTQRGIAPSYMDRTGRNALRMIDIHQKDFEDRYKRLKEKHLKLLKVYEAEDLISHLEDMEPQWFESIEFLRSFQFVNDPYLWESLRDVSVLAEGAQGTMLDIQWGTYPYVTSSSTITGSVAIGLGIPPSKIRKVIGVAKAYTTRVGNGPFPTEMPEEISEKLRQRGGEYGSTTGRPRRCGWLDLVALKYATMLNGVDELIITKADVLTDFEPLKVAVEYDLEGKRIREVVPYLDRVKPIYQELKPWQQVSLDDENFMSFIATIEDYLSIPVTMVSYGPHRDQILSVKSMGTMAS
ncbi:MAG: adenylosuccinate synthase [Chlorobi bacterium]|nr:adenylosuccinate synthase [Chlorobiota bacterium]